MTTPANRRGSALVIAVALLALASALLAGASASAHAANRAEETLEALHAADAECRVVLAESVVGWRAADDSLAPGASSVRAVAARQNGFGGWPVRSSVRVLRLDSLRYVLAVSSEVGPASSPRARRRTSVILARRAMADTTLPILSPVPVRHWSAAELF
ncbi:MAG: hypothetical protein ABIY52_19335 [Gemmatimonadaceae bacterium]